MLTKVERKKMVLRWWDEYFKEGNKEVLLNYVHKDYVQHIHFLPDGPDGIHIFLDMQGGTFPTEIKHVIDDGELIAVHFQGPGPAIPDHPWHGMELAVIDFFTMKDDKFYEHWYAVEPVAPTESGYDVFADVLTPHADVPLEKEKENRETVLAAFNNAFNGDTKGFSRIVSASPYIEHSPHVAKGTKNLFEAYQKHYDSPDPPKGKVIRIMAEGDLVMAYNSYMFPRNKEIVACHLFRVWDGKIVEHWDIHTPVPPPEEFQHPNGMY